MVRVINPPLNGCCRLSPMLLSFFGNTSRWLACLQGQKKIPHRKINKAFNGKTPSMSSSLGLTLIKNDFKILYIHGISFSSRFNAFAIHNFYFLFIVLLLIHCIAVENLHGNIKRARKSFTIFRIFCHLHFMLNTIFQINVVFMNERASELFL